MPIAKQHLFMRKQLPVLRNLSNYLPLKLTSLLHDNTRIRSTLEITPIRSMQLWL